MSDITTTLSTSDWIRPPLVYAHLLLCAFAITQVLRTDLAIFRGRFTPGELERTARGVAYLLAALWITGLSLVWLDTRFDPALLTTKPKLLFKLLCVLVLTANGILLHAFSFPLVTGRGRLALPASVLLVLSGALSTGHWLLAVFIGVTDLLGHWSLRELLAGYVLFVLTTSFAAVACEPMMRRRLLCWRARQTFESRERPVSPASPISAVAPAAAFAPAPATGGETAWRAAHRPAPAPATEHRRRAVEQERYAPSDELRVDFIHL